MVPMLFTPVPGSTLYRDHERYLKSQVREDGSKWAYIDYNGKLLPFLEYNQRLNPELQASDYLDIESLMMQLNNSKVHQQRLRHFRPNRGREDVPACSGWDILVWFNHSTGNDSHDKGCSGPFSRSFWLAMCDRITWTYPGSVHASRDTDTPDTKAASPTAD